MGLRKLADFCETLLYLLVKIVQIYRIFPFQFFQCLPADFMDCIFPWFWLITACNYQIKPAVRKNQCLPMRIIIPAGKRLLCIMYLLFYPSFSHLQIFSCPENFASVSLPKFSPDTHFVSQNAIRSVAQPLKPHNIPINSVK